MEPTAQKQAPCGKCGLRPRVSRARRYCRQCFAEAQRLSRKRQAEDWAKLRKIVLKRTGRTGATV